MGRSAHSLLRWGPSFHHHLRSKCWWGQRRVAVIVPTIKRWIWLAGFLKRAITPIEFPQLGSFHRAISLSGSSMCFWALNDDAARSTEIYAELFDCPRRTSREIVDCLRTINASDLIEKQFSSSKVQLSWIDHVTLKRLEFPTRQDPYKMLPFNPRVDAEREFPFVPAKPRTLIESKQFSHVPYITGINQNEGAFQVAGTCSSTKPKLL